MPDADLPPGYEVNHRGELVHLVYEEGATGRSSVVIPSGKSAGTGGGSHGFDPHSADIPQNLIEVTANGSRVVARLTRAELAAKQKVSGGMDLKQLNREEAVVAEARAKKRKKRKEPADGSVPEKPAVVKVEQPPVEVTVSGPFGQITHLFSAVFVDGMCLVLATDHRRLTSSYKLPDPGGTPMQLQVRWGGTAVNCFWAGISFTLPDQSVTFTVLLVGGNEQRQAADTETYFG